LKQSHDEYLARSVALLKAAKPVSSGGLGFFEMKRQFDDLNAKFDDLGSRWAKFVIEVKVMALELPSTNDSAHHCLKPTKERKSSALAALTANLTVHESSIKTLRGASINVSSTTFGAPSASSMGYLTGGLRKVTTLNLAKIEEQIADPARSRTPEAMLKQLSCQFEATARDIVVASQATTAVVSAAVDLLTRLISNRSTAALKQVAHAGLLVHSVSLLSTSGNEEGMLDDFSGAYERLHISLRLEAESGDSDDEMITVTGVVSAHNSSIAKIDAAGAIIVTLRICCTSDRYEWLERTLGDSKGSLPVLVVIPVLFNLGKEIKFDVVS
jgi:hypothetical protein